MLVLVLVPAREPSASEPLPEPVLALAFGPDHLLVVSSSHRTDLKESHHNSLPVVAASLAPSSPYTDVVAERGSAPAAPEKLVAAPVPWLRLVMP